MRLTDELENIDFHPRSRLPMMLVPILSCVGAFLAVVIFTLEIGAIHEKLIFCLVIAVIMTTVCLLLLLTAKQTYDLLMMTELQNTLLASAAQLNMRFCLIVEEGGIIAYMDRGFQKFFPPSVRYNISTIQGVFSSIGATEEVERTIMSAMESGRNDRGMCTLHDAEGQTFPLMIMIDRLPRPKGFFLIRGRDYVAKRKSSNAEMEISGSVLLTRVLDTLSDGALVAQLNGYIVYANPALESWLGFGEGELQNLAAALPQIIFQYGNLKAGQLLMDDYTGEITLQRKDRTLIKASIQQSCLYENSKKIGISARLVLSQQ